MSSLCLVVAGAWRYRVLLVDGSDPRLGEHRSGFADWQHRELGIRRDMSIEAQLETLAHEFAEAWLFHVPAPRNSEEQLDLSNTIHRNFDDQLRRVGGVEALLRLRLARVDKPAPAEADKPAEATPVSCVRKPSGRRAYCGRCERAVNGANVRIDLPRWDHAVGGLVADMALYCGHCEHLQRWVGAVDEFGVPTGVPVGEPRYNRGAAMAAFLTQHPELADLPD